MLTNLSYIYPDKITYRSNIKTRNILKNCGLQKSMRKSVFWFLQDQKYIQSFQKKIFTTCLDKLIVLISHFYRTWSDSGKFLTSSVVISF